MRNAIFRCLTVRYIMVTHWDNHWDRIPNNQTYFHMGMLKGKMSTEKIRDHTPTLFIKLNERTGEIEGVWEGETYDFRIEHDRDRISFRVKIYNELQPEDLPLKYHRYREGWYIEEGVITFDVFD